MVAPIKSKRIPTRVRISKSGQVTLPKKIRNKLGVTTGEFVEFSEDADGVIFVRPSKVMTVEEIAAMAKPLPAGQNLEAILRDARKHGSVREKYRTGSMYDDLD